MSQCGFIYIPYIRKPPLATMQTYLLNVKKVTLQLCMIFLNPFIMDFQLRYDLFRQVGTNIVHNVISTLMIGAICYCSTHKTTWYHILQGHFMYLHCYTHNESDSRWLYFTYLIHSTIQVYYFIIRHYTITIYEQIIHVFKCQQIRKSVTYSHNNCTFQYSLTTQSRTNFSLFTLQLHFRNKHIYN
jgi:hypothetical protein